jgi:hypothetical protein
MLYKSVEEAAKMVDDIPNEVFRMAGGFFLVD